MKRVLLVHWNEPEARERADRLKALGYEVDSHSSQDGGLKEKFSRPLAAVVIDLGRLPSHGKAVAGWMRERKSTRLIPILFVDGDADRVAGTRKLFPDAVYAGWGGIRSSLKAAVSSPPKDVVVVRAMDGYSGTPLPKKLGLKPGLTVRLAAAPEGFERKLDPLPENVRILRNGKDQANLVLLFAKSRREMEKAFPPATRRLADGGSIWIMWPKKASGLQTDLGEAAVRAFGLASGFVDYKICAVDATWSGLLFARRRSKP